MPRSLWHSGTLDPSAKKPLKVKVISSKVQPLHRPRRSRSQTVNRTVHKTGKGIITEMKPTAAPRKKTVCFQESRIPDMVQTEKQWQPSSSTEQPSSEMRPRRSRAPVAQDSATLKPNVDRRPSQATEVIVPRQRSGTHRSQLNTERTTKCPSLPVKKEHISSGGGAVRSHTPVCTTNKESKTLVPVAFQTRPTKERPLTSCAVPEERQGLNHPK